MIKKKILIRFGIIIGIALLGGIISAPASFYSNTFGTESSITQKMSSLKITLGLDLAGGAELDYQIDLSDAEAQNNDDDPDNDVDIQRITESVRDALERRVNPAGVGEVIVKRSQVNNEEHILIQLPPSSNVDKAKRDAEKDNRLEFFEEDPKLEETTRTQIAKEITFATPETWDSKVGTIIDDKIITHEKGGFRYKDQIPDKAFAEKLFAAQPNTIIQEIIETQTEMDYSVDEDGNLKITSYPKKVLAIVRVQEKKTEERVKHEPPKAKARHILFGYPEAQRALNLGSYNSIDEAKEASQVIIDAPESIPEEEREEKVKEAKRIIEEIEEFPYKTKEEAKTKAEKMLARLQSEGTDEFSVLAKSHSTEGSAQNSGGDLGEFSPGQMVPAFDKAIFFNEEPESSDKETDEEESTEAIDSTPVAKEIGLLDEVIETDFGFHVIELLSYDEGGEKTTQEEQVKYDMIAWNKNEITWSPTALGGSHLENASVGYDQIGSPLVNLYFDAEGGDLFAQLTENVANRNGQCNAGGTGGVCRLGIKVGGKWITTPTVREKIIGRQSQISGNFTFESAQDLADGLNLGAIDAPVILKNETKIKPELGTEQLTKSLKAGAFGLLATMVFMIFGYRFAGVVASLSLIIYTLVFITILKIWPQSFGGPIVLSLSGMAGIALSIGLAVDGNILIFERMQEEFVKRKDLGQAVDLGFERAWTAIRDSNLTTLLTCIILFSMGSSIIKGFAVTLIVGTILSMFTAINVSRNLLRFFLLFDFFQKPGLFGITEKFVEKTTKRGTVKIRKRK